MNREKRIKYLIFTWLILLSIGSMVGFYSVEKGKDGQGSSQRLDKTTRAYYMKINNIELPLNNAGVIADVTIPPYTSEGKFDGLPFLFSSGFAMSGYVDLGQPTEFLWANAVATASRIRDYQAGPVKADGTPSDPNDPKHVLYIVRSDEEPFGPSWQEWKDAVALGAEFYDGDKNGKYEPVDKNGNGMWDPDEDRPDLLGDETVWCVINDGVPAKDRRYTDVNPLGIEIHQTVFGFASSGLLGNILFVRYKVINKNAQGKVLDSVYFSVWADPDIGDYTDDLVGCDVPASASGYPKTPPEGRNAGYVYNEGSDPTYGPNPPTFLIDFFQGPFVQTGNNADTAFNIKGPYLGIDTLVGYKQLGISSFLQYFQSTPPDQADPANRFELRYYTLGYNRQGRPLNPCTWGFGSVVGGVNCNNVDPRFFYSGDPHRNIGWIQTTAADERMMVNTGKFRLRPYLDTVIITAAYVVGRSTSATASIEEAKRISDFAQFIYDQNFKSPPAPPVPKVTAITTENSIELVWKTSEAVGFRDKTVAYDMRFEGFELWTFRTNSVGDVFGGVQNAKILERWDVKNKIDDVLQQDSKTGIISTIHKKGIQLDTNIYLDPVRGYIRYKITTDPWTGGPIVKGKKYYFALVTYALNHDVLIPVNPGAPTSNYYISGAAFVGNTVSVKKIINDGIIPGQDLNDPYNFNLPTTVAGATEATAFFDEVEKSKLTGDNYEITFSRDPSSTLYFMTWSLKNLTKNQTLISNSRVYYNLLPDDQKSTTPIVDGVSIRINWVPAEIKSPIRSLKNNWLRNFVKNSTGVFYLANDITSDTIYGLTPITVSNRLAVDRHGNFSADKLGQIEIRFSSQSNFGKAYRFVSNTTANVYRSGYLSTSPNKRWWIDVPFQVWMVDQRKGINRQLACGIMEYVPSGGKPDGVWDPDTNIAATKEYIIIFDQDYDPNMRQREYIGDTTSTSTARAASLMGWNPAADFNFSAEQLNRARARWLGAIYLVALEKRTSADTWSDGDKIVIPISYPITPADKFTFKTTPAGTPVSMEYKKSLFDRVNVYPNPLYAYNPAVGYYGDVSNPKNDEPFVTFTNLPEEVTIKIYTLSGQLLQVLYKNDKKTTLNWNLKNKDGLRAASGVYLAVVSSPGLGEKVLKFSIIQPQKQIKRF
ncbi:MAG: T9SS type A sorting domain-containing protein [Ignavibacteria bacterium]|nr:T9SS type A sorting domain-containing protein [Ignavibacteria bacterium]